MYIKVLCKSLVVFSMLLVFGCPNPATENPKGVNADLTSLTVSAGTLNPIFTANTTDYTVNVPNTTAAITITGIKADANAEISENNGVEQTLSDGANTITISVTAEDGVTVKDYVVTVMRRAFDLVMIDVPGGRYRENVVTHIIDCEITKHFRMSQTEITREQFYAVFSTDPVVVEELTSKSSGTTDPVMMTNWYHAIAFCNKLSMIEGLNPVYTVVGVDFNTLAYVDIPTAESNDIWDAVTADWTANGYRLPTEIEWMWAAMGAPADGQAGGINTTGYVKGYAGSLEGYKQTNLGNYAWYGTNASGKSHPVGMKYPNEIGLYDMSGNVWEWCWDWYAPYPDDSPLIDYRGSISGLGRTVRGGGWTNGWDECKLAERSSNVPVAQYGGVGFRVILPGL